MRTNRTLIALSGLPGTGKSTVARILQSRLQIPVFAKDELEAVLVRSELASVSHPQLGTCGYEILTRCAESVLTAGGSVVLDSVCSFESIRNSWRSLAEIHGADFRVIECVCSAPEIHRQRLASRRRGIPGWPEISWEDVVKVKSYYQEMRGERLVVDSAEPIATVEQKVLAHFQPSS